MYLVDTSVWITYIQGQETPSAQFLDELLPNPIAVGINDLILMEILQGAKSQADFDKLHRYFTGQQFYRFIDPEASHGAAAQMYFDCRRKGITVRSSIDCLIAQCAIEHQLILLHHDRDYQNMQLVAPELQQKHFLD